MGVKDTANLALIPAAYKTSKVYSALPTDGDGDFTFSRSGTGATRINKAGLVETMGANVPRLNYNLTNGTPASCPSLLLEPSRTNLITQSETYTTVSKANLNVTDNTSITDPKGNTNTKTLTATDNNQPRLEWRGTAVPGSNTSYSMSFFVRRNTARYVAIAHFSQTGEYAIFDLLSGNVENDVGTQTAKIEEFPNDWYRISKSFEVPSSASYNFWKFTLCTQTNPFVGVSGEKADVFGLQLEEGSYPTSLIPTSGSAVTRTVDTCKLENFANMPTDYPFTVYSNNNVDLINSNQWAWSILDISSAVKYLGLAFTNSGFIQIHRRNSSNDVDSITTTVTQGENFKFAITFISNTSYKYSINGGTTVTVTGASDVDFDFNDFLIGQQRVSVDEGNRNQCSEFMLFNEALTDAELKTLTS